MNFAQLALENYKTLTDKYKGIRNQKAQVKAAHYIENLIKEVGHEMTTWSLEDFPSYNSERVLPLKEAEINTEFFSVYKQRKAAAPQNLEDIDEHTKKLLEQLKKTSIERLINNCRYHYENYLLDAKKFHNNAAIAIRSAHEQYLKIKSLEQDDASDSFLDGINSVLKSGFYKLEKLELDTIYFKTIPDVILEYSNKASKVDARVNLGTFTVRYNITHSFLVVESGERNVLANGSYIHPHVGSNGSICWGNASETIARALATRDAKTALTVLQALLTSYNHANPYVALETFQQAYEQTILNLQPSTSVINTASPTYCVVCSVAVMPSHFRSCCGICPSAEHICQASSPLAVFDEMTDDSFVEVGGGGGDTTPTRNAASTSSRTLNIQADAALEILENMGNPGAQRYSLERNHLND